MEQASRIRTGRKIILRTALAAVAGAMLVSMPAQRYATAGPDSGCSRPGTIWWSELLAPETERLTEFYSKVIGWKAKVVDAEDPSQPPRSPADRYTIFMDGDQEVAGLMRANHPDAIHSGVGWFTYIQVADVEVAAATAKASGGSVLRAPEETPDGHRIAVISDPMGIVFGIITPSKKGC